VAEQQSQRRPEEIIAEDSLLQRRQSGRRLVISWGKIKSRLLLND
jgi:hypothetical protein